MAIIIEKDGIRATIQDYRIVCDNEVESFRLGLLLHRHGPSGSDPSPDHTLALEAGKLGWIIVSDDTPEPTPIPVPKSPLE